MKRLVPILTALFAAWLLAGCTFCRDDFQTRPPNEEKASKGVPISAWNTLEQGPPDTPTFAPGDEVVVPIHMKQVLTAQLNQLLMTRIDGVFHTPPDEAFSLESGKAVSHKSIFKGMNGCIKHPASAKTVEISFDLRPQGDIEPGTYVVRFTCANEDGVCGTPDGQGFRWGRFIVKVED